MRPARFALILCAFTLLSYGAVSSVQVGDTARQQGVVTFRVSDPNRCTLTVYRDSALTDKVNDTNNSLFSASEGCTRTYNIVTGGQVTAVIGRRTSETASDGKLYSRSLEVSRTYYVVITDLADSSKVTVSFTTANIPWGDTHVEDVPYNDSGFNHWGYPDLDWTDAGLNKTYVDPVSGVALKRTPRNMKGGGGQWGDKTDFEFNFSGVFDLQSAWTNVQNATSTSTAGPFATYSGTGRNPLFFAFRQDTPVSNPWDVANSTWEDARINIYGSAVSTGNADDSKVLVCLGVNYNPASDTCASEIEAALPAAATKVQAPALYPTFEFLGWQLGRPLSSGEASVPNGNAAVANSAVTLSSGYLPIAAAPGMKINIAGQWYTIGVLQTATKFTLAEPNVNASGVWYLGAFGVRVRKKTAVNNQINVAATYSIAYSANVNMPANGVRDFCHTLTFPVNYQADGTTVLNSSKQGRLCMNGYNLFLLLEDGETRFLSTLFHPDLSYTGRVYNIPLGAFSQTDPYTMIGMHTDDSGPAGAPERLNYAFYEIKYDPSTCHFKAWPGNSYNTVTAPADCVTWTNKTPYSGGNTITQQLAAAVTTNPIWDPSFSAGDFNLAALSGRWAILNKFASSQDNPCFTAVFDLTNYVLVKVSDSFTGSLNGYRWGGCHSNGMDVPYSADYGDMGFSNLYARTNPGYLSGPFLLQGVTAKSLDGGTTWTADTSLTNVQAANCGSNPYSITGLECVKFKLSSDQPCDMNATALESSKWPCAWHTGYGAPMTLQVGDYFSRVSGDDGTAVAVDGKREKFRVLSKTSDGAGGWIVEVERWSACDNINSDFTQGAVQYFDHLYSGIGGNTHPNGWKAYMTATGACGGTLAWVNLPKALAQTDFHIDNTQITIGHNTFGVSPDGQHLVQVGPGASRVGDLPGMAGLPQQFNFATDSSSFAGFTRSASGQVEAYPALSNWSAATVGRRSVYWDFRHLNPDAGSSPEALIGDWGQNYTLVSGQQFTYKVDVYQDSGSFKERRPNVFSTLTAFKDISGPGSSIDDSRMNTYCNAYKAGECRTDSTAGAVYVVAKNAYIEMGRCVTDTYKTYSPCVTPLWSNAGWMIEADSQRDDPLGYRFRRITMGLVGPSAQYQYTSPHMVADSSFALLRAGYPNGVRPDLLVVKMPPPASTDSIDRTTYVPIAVGLPAGSGYARIRFGYAEHGTAANFYCTSRQESCVTDSAMAPFAYAQTDALTAADCRNGCTIKIPALSGRVVYYRVEKSKDGSTGWVNGVTQVAAVK